MIFKSVSRSDKIILNIELLNRNVYYTISKIETDKWCFLNEDQKLHACFYWNSHYKKSILKDEYFLIKTNFE